VCCVSSNGSPADSPDGVNSALKPGMRMVKSDFDPEAGNGKVGAVC